MKKPLGESGSFTMDRSGSRQRVRTSETAAGVCRGGGGLSDGDV